MKFTWFLVYNNKRQKQHHQGSGEMFTEYTWGGCLGFWFWDT